MAFFPNMFMNGANATIPAHDSYNSAGNGVMQH